MGEEGPLLQQVQHILPLLHYLHWPVALELLSVFFWGDQERLGRRKSAAWTPAHSFQRLQLLFQHMFALRFALLDLYLPVVVDDECGFLHTVVLFSGHLQFAEFLLLIV